MNDAPQTPPANDATPEKAAASAKKEAPEDAAPAPIPAGRIGQVLEKLGHTVEHLGNDASGTEMIRLTRGQAVEVSRHLRDDEACQFDMLLLVTGVDWKTHRESVYHLYSTHQHTYLILKITADEADKSPSLYPVWPAVDWHEREAYDLLGVDYEGHPDLRRILMPNYWIGHPLRKDYKEEDPRLVWNRR